jgi:hypothetical protein
MSDQWDPDLYRQRAEEWRQRAAELPVGRARCEEIADGYSRLADLIEAERRSRGPTDE